MTTDEELDGLADVLREWIPEQRWFAGKGRPVHSVRRLRRTVLGGEDPQLLQTIVEVDQGGGRSDRYQLLVGLRSDLPEALGHSFVASVGSSDRRRVAYQAVHDQELTALLLELIARGADVDGVRFGTEPGVELDPAQRARPMGAEQSNTSLVFGQRYILKLFRRLQAGRSPDLELHRALVSVGCTHIAAPLGSIEGELDGEVVTFGMLTDFFPNTADGWAMATASVRDLLRERSLGSDVSAADVGGDFASEAYRLGAAVAAVHSDLARALGSAPAGAGHLDAVADGMHARLDAVLGEVGELEEHAPALRAAYDAVRELPVGDVAVQRLHGDLHLGQVLRSVTGWVLIDFEGEPATPLASRRAPASPLRDVAGMLRSFDYAAQHLLVTETEVQQHAPAALEWAERNRTAFCDGYASAADDPRDAGVLLRAFELDKAVYEVAYEHHNRPHWLPIPLRSISRLTGVVRPGAAPA